MKQFPTDILSKVQSFDARKSSWNNGLLSRHYLAPVERSDDLYFTPSHCFWNGEFKTVLFAEPKVFILNSRKHCALNEMATIFLTTFSNAFLEIDFFLYLIQVCSWRSNWQCVTIGSGNGLAPNRRHAITRTNDDPASIHVHHQVLMS